MPRELSRHDEWVEVLNQLEASLGSGARNAVLAAAGDRFSTGVQWRAPEHLGQLPRDLEKRARLLLAGQLAGAAPARTLPGKSWLYGMSV